MATIKDVARQAGVAVGTVSRYLNGAIIKEENRRRIEEAVKKLDFRINPIARGLKTSKTKTVGIIIPNFSDIYSTTIVKSIENELYKFDYNIFACDSCSSKELEKQKAELLSQKMVDGLIVYPCSDNPSYLESIQKSGIPVLTLDTLVNGLKCDQVLTDNISATYEATQWLINNNHKRIGIITGSQTQFTASERLKGYKRACEDYAIKVDDNLVKAEGFKESSGYKALVELVSMENPPTAVIACNYYTTIGAVKAIYDKGLLVPKELSLIGFDNLGLSELVRPPLTVIVQPMEEIGQKAAELILKRIGGGYGSFPSIVRLKTEMIMRESTRKL